MEKARFDARIPKEQKELFEMASVLGGFRTLTDFIIHSAHIAAQKILSDHQTILAGKKDRELFFSELMNPSEPNQALRDAARKYQELTQDDE